MKAPTLLFLFLVGLLSMPSYGRVQAQNTSSDRQAIAMLKEFYTADITEGCKLPSLSALKKLRDLPKHYCTVGLLRKLNAQYQHGYVEADPFLQVQDVNIFWLKTLAVRRDLRSANAYTVSYRDAGSDFKAVIHLTVIRQGNDFKIAALR